MRARVLSATILTCVALATVASAASLDLYAVQFPEKRSVELSFRRTSAAPQALIRAEVRKDRLQDALSKVASTQSSARGYIVNLPDILFDVNEATLKPEAKVAIAKLAGILLVMPDLNLRVEGHTESTGTAEHNQKLSEQRAQSVVAFVTEQGVEASRLTGVGYGQTRPLADNESAEGRKKNRRVEIVVAEGLIQEAAP